MPLKVWSEDHASPLIFSLLVLQEIIQACETIILLKVGFWVFLCLGFFLVARFSFGSKEYIDIHSDTSSLPHHGPVTKSLWMGTLRSSGLGQLPRREDTTSWQFSPATDS